MPCSVRAPAQRRDGAGNSDRPARRRTCAGLHASFDRRPAFSEDFDRFEQADTAVLPISVDSAPSLKEYKAKYHLRQDLLSDFKRDVCRRYGTLLEDPFYSKRAYFLIDKQGMLRWAHTEDELGVKRDDAELLRVIRTL